MPVLSIAEQTRIFLLSCGTGFLLGSVYDIFRFLRLAFSIKKRAVFIFDISFSLLATFISFIFILTANKGEVRWYIIAGEIIGLVIYYFALGEVVLKLFKNIISSVKKVNSVFLRLFSWPFKKFKALKTHISDKLVKSSKKD